MTKEKQLNDLKVALNPYFPVMAKASDAVLDQEVSEYPIFVLTNEIAHIGIPLIDEITSLNSWSMNMSSLEEFSTKQVIQAGKVDDFMGIFKDPKSYFCLFVVEQGGANFVFIPRP